jgi:hypothetical protein
MSEMKNGNLYTVTLVVVPHDETLASIDLWWQSPISLDSCYVCAVFSVPYVAGIWFSGGRYRENPRIRL